jgi:hypothetical protein
MDEWAPQPSFLTHRTVAFFFAWMAMASLEEEGLFGLQKICH